MKLKLTYLNLALVIAGLSSSQAIASSFTEALTTGKTSANFNLRYEGVDQDNALKDADALTLRTRLSYTTGVFKGFSSMVEFEDSRTVLGIDDYKNTLVKNNDHSVIADPETTEVDQMFIKYSNKSFSTKLGRQVITMDNHRFVGHVGWRQDRQTFDGATFEFKPADGMKLNYGYLTQRNRIFGESKDIDSKDHLFNASYKSSVGKISAYGYLLEADNDTSNSLDTYGARYNGSTKFGEKKTSYTIEYATQDSDTAAGNFSSKYFLAEIGSTIANVGIKVGYELLGSDDGKYGFSTPLATLHKFNGWSDQFLGTPKEGLADVYIQFSGKALGGKWAMVYHDFSADDSSATVDDLGSEINAVYTKKYGKNYSAGIKFASYSAGDSAAGKVDTDKLWLWVNAKF